MELIRLLLLEVEGQSPKPDFSSYTDQQQLYHAALLIEAGLIHGEVVEGRDGQPAGAVPLSLT